jgi:hypothetical protein
VSTTVLYCYYREIIIKDSLKKQQAKPRIKRRRKWLVKAKRTALWYHWLAQSAKAAIIPPPKTKRTILSVWS